MNSTVIFQNCLHRGRHCSHHYTSMLLPIPLVFIVLSSEASGIPGWADSALPPHHHSCTLVSLSVSGWMEGLGLQTNGAAYLWRKTISTLTSSRSLCRKSFRKLETLSRVICPQTTMCLNRRGRLAEAGPAMTQAPTPSKTEEAHSCRKAFIDSQGLSKSPAPIPRRLWGKAAALAGAQQLLDRKGIWLLTWCCTKSY